MKLPGSRISQLVATDHTAREERIPFLSWSYLQGDNHDACLNDVLIVLPVIVAKRSFRSCGADKIVRFEWSWTKDDNNRSIVLCSSEATLYKAQWENQKNDINLEDYRKAPLCWSSEARPTKKVSLFDFIHSHCATPSATGNLVVLLLIIEFKY